MHSLAITTEAFQNIATQVNTERRRYSCSHTQWKHCKVKKQACLFHWI